MAEDIRRDVLRAAARLFAAEATAQRRVFLQTSSAAPQNESTAWLNSAARCLILADRLEPEDG